jgi:hypothetical protein
MKYDDELLVSILRFSKASRDDLLNVLSEFQRLKETELQLTEFRLKNLQTRINIGKDLCNSLLRLVFKLVSIYGVSHLLW